MKKFLTKAGITKLKELIDEDFVGKKQGSANAGKALCVGADGAVTPADIDGLEMTEPEQTTLTIQPNVFYKWGEAAALTVTLGTPETGRTSEYIFQFVSGTTPTVLTVTPASGTLSWVGGEPTIEASKTYQVSILNNVAVIVGA